MTRPVLVVLLILLLVAGCATTHPHPEPAPLDLPGPTTLSREPQGYVLSNRRARVVIDDRTGDVVAWGRHGQPTARVTAGLWGCDGRLGRDGVADATVTAGHVEPRDEQTWQFLGTDTRLNVGWRKIYVLEGDRVFASYLVQNLRKDAPITCGVLLTVDPPHAAGRVQPFNERQDLMPPDGVVGAVVGDVRILQPGERLSLTTAWQFE